MESRVKFSNSKKGIKPKHLDYMAIAQLNSKKVVAKKDNIELTFDSIKEAAEKLKINRTCISKALHKKIHVSGGYNWYFAEQSALKNSVNSGKVCDDNPELSSLNDIT
jgi:hypothetical protein